METAAANTPAVIVFDGEIGAGKTTLIELVRRGLATRGHRVTVVAEPVEEWERIGILQEFYEDMPPEHRGFVAYDFQTYTFVTRVAETIRAVEAEPDTQIFLLERSILTDRCVFMELQRELVGARRMEMYDAWWKLWSRIMPLTPSKVVYLKPTLDNCMSRVATRGRKGEVGARDVDGDREQDGDRDNEASARGGVSAAYQARLRRAHEAYLQGLHADEFPDMPALPFDVERDVVVLEGPLADDDFANDPAAAERIVQAVLEKARPGH